MNNNVAVETRPGWKTTEFWVVVIGILLGVVQQATGAFNITDQRVLLFQSILASAYAVGRGLAKAGVPNVAADVPAVTTTSSAPSSERTDPMPPEPPAGFAVSERTP